MDVFELPDRKNIGKLFLKFELIFLDYADFSFDPSQILILQYPIPPTYLPPSPSLSNFNTILIMLFIGIPVFFLPH